jgi:hypothetical protein
MEFQEKTTYVTEYNKRVSNAQTHTNAMFIKYQQRAFALGMDSSTPGFSYWKTKGHNEYGQVIWEHEYPIPFSELYKSFFLRVLYWAEPSLLVPYLEEAFVGDIVDRDYIESLLVGFEEMGVSQLDKLIIAYDNFKPRPAGPTATVKELLAHPELDSGGIIIGGPKLAARMETVRGWLLRKANKISSNETTTKENEVILQQRRLEAYDHQKNMVEKYCTQTGDGEAIGTWSSQREIIDLEGNPRLLFYQEYPKPHSSLYLHHFLNMIMRKDTADIITWLNREFHNDVIDKNYVETLLTELEKLGMNVKGTTVIIDGSVINSYPPVDPKTSDYLYSEDYTHAVNQNIFYGGEDFRRRAFLIRGWCQGKTLYASALPYNEATIDPVFIPISTDKQTSIVNPDASPSTALERAGRPTANRLDEDLTAYFSWGFNKSHCDKLAKMLSLCPPSEIFKEVKNAHSRIWVLADAIKNTDKSAALSAKPAHDLVEAFGKRYGYTVEGKLTKKAANQTYQDNLKLILDAIERMKKQGEFN